MLEPTLGSYVWLLPGPSQSSESCMTAAPTRTRGGAHCHCLIFTKNTSTPIRTSVTHMKELRIKLKITKIYGDAGHDQHSHLSPFLGYLLVLFSAVCSDARQGGKNVESCRIILPSGNNTACTLRQDICCKINHNISCKISHNIKICNKNIIDF